MIGNTILPALRELRRNVLRSFLTILGIVIAVAAVSLLVGGIVLVAFLFSAAAGVVFGYFPALNAARLDPIVALRHE